MRVVFLSPDEGWAVKDDRGRKVLSRHRTEIDAQRAALEHAAEDEAEGSVVVHGHRGSIRWIEPVPPRSARA